VQRRDECLPFHRVHIGVLACGEQLLELVNHQHQARHTGRGTGLPV
jgi:hypothetical protein